MDTSVALKIELSADLYKALRRVAADQDKSEAELATEAIQTFLQQPHAVDPLLGLFADDPDLIDTVATDAMLSREKTPWRVINNGQQTADRSLLDTDILSEVLKARDSNVVTWVTTYKQQFERLTSSSITVMEVVKGIHKGGQPASLQRFLTALHSSEILVFDAAAAEIAGRIYGDLERAGQPIGRVDVMIAAIALTHNLTLVTGNLRHYERIREAGYAELALGNWRKAT